MSRILDALWPWRVIARQRRKMEFLDGEVFDLRQLLENTQRERDTARRQFVETQKVNQHNAAAHRASEVAALRNNNAQQREIERLGGGGRTVRHLSENGPVPAMALPKPIPVPDPKTLPENR